MKHFKLYNLLVGLAVFAVAAWTYLSTIESTASFWDCGEFISTAYRLDVGHPPGAPFFMLTAHFFSLFAHDATQVAVWVNRMSALFSALTILFLFWTITALCKKMFADGKTATMTLSQGVGTLFAGAVGALAYTFSDTFWFSAVEGEVYAYSSLFTALVFWLILKWDEHADEEGSDRWLVLIAYLMGLSIGVHLLNLLAIPAIVLVYYYRKFKPTWKGFCAAMGVSVVLLAVVLYGMVPGFVQVACWFELLFVNLLGMPFNTGVLVYILLTVLSLIWAIYETAKGTNYWRMAISFMLGVLMVGIPFFGGATFKYVLLAIVVMGLLFTYFKMGEKKSGLVSARWLNTGILCIAMILMGYSSYAVIVIRSGADPSMDQNSPDNVFALKSYLNREQYGDRPLFYGASYDAPVALRVEGNMCVPEEEEGAPQYSPMPKDNENQKDEYEFTGYQTSYKMQPEFMMLFPRMYSGQGNHKEAYQEWADIRSGKTNVSYDYCGQRRRGYKPSMVENLKFFFAYQCNFMYWRYFMWNFSGRQNDIQGYGEVDHGNWITGIPFIDNAMLGDQSTMPDSLKQNKGHNVYYLLPLILGLLGICFQFDQKEKGKQNFLLVLLLFLMTGLAIVVYLNQTPYQPRERDYAYAGSFYAFTIWIGMGVLFLCSLIDRFMKSQVAKTCVATVIGIICLGVPYLMAEQNWDDHDRSGRYVARDFGHNYLASCKKNAIIFTNGDNDTFPLWYNQEVEGDRTDVRVCNLSYLQTDWYISQMTRPYFESDGLPISWKPSQYRSGQNEVVRVENTLPGPVNMNDAFAYVLNQTNEDSKAFPSNQLYLPLPGGDSLIAKLGSRLTRSEMMVLEMIRTNQWKRPIYFAVTVGNDYYQGLEPYFELTGLAYQITPKRSEDGRERVNTDEMYDNMMHKFRFGGVDAEKIYLDENVLRMCRTHRMMFAQLAMALYNESAQAEFRVNHDPTLSQAEKDQMMKDSKLKKQRAEEVLDYCQKVLPARNIRNDYSSLSIIQCYFLLGQPKKALAIAEPMADDCVQYLQWAKKLRPQQRRSVSRSMQQNAGILGQMCQMAQEYKQDKFLQKYGELYMQLSQGLN